MKGFLDMKLVKMKRIEQNLFYRKMPQRFKTKNKKKFMIHLELLTICIFIYH